MQFKSKSFFNAVKFRQSALGQGMTEYIIIVALIAVSAIGVYSSLGQTVRNQTAGLAKEISGQDATDAIAAAKKGADTSAKRADTAKGLGNFNDSNR